jgi:hypothetical protein
MIGSHVVLAVRLEADVAQQNHLVVTLDFLEGALEQVEGVDGVAGEELLVGLYDALRRAGQAFARRVVAGPADQCLHGLQRLLARRPLEIRKGFNLLAAGHAVPASS